MNGTPNDIHKMKQGYNIMRKNNRGWINIMKETGERERMQEKERYVERNRALVINYA